MSVQLFLFSSKVFFLIFYALNDFRKLKLLRRRVAKAKEVINKSEIASTLYNEYISGERSAVNNATIISKLVLIHLLNLQNNKYKINFNFICYLTTIINNSFDM